MRSYLLAIALIGLSSDDALAATYRFEPTPDSRIALTVEKTGICSGRKHVFEFPAFSAAASFDPENLSNSKVELMIEAGSAVCRDTWVTEKDRRTILAYMFQEVLNVSRYPRLKFQSADVKSLGSQSLQLSGSLVIRGIERPAQVILEVEKRSGALMPSPAALWCAFMTMGSNHRKRPWERSEPGMK